MSKTQNLIGRAMSALGLPLPRKSSNRFMSLLACLAAWACLLSASSTFAQSTIKLDSSQFEVVHDSFVEGGQMLYRTRFTLPPMYLEGVTGIRGRLRLEADIPAAFILTRSWTSSFESNVLETWVSEDDPNVLMGDFVIQSKSPWTSEGGFWMEWVYFTSDAGYLDPSRLSMDDGIVQVDIIEGDCKMAPDCGDSQIKDTKNVRGHDAVLSPNPVVGVLALYFPEGTPLPDRLRIINAQGQMIQEQAFTTEIDARALQAGSYILVGLRGSTTLFHQRFLKL